MRRIWQRIAALFVLGTILAVPASSQIPPGGSVFVIPGASSVTGSVSAATITSASTPLLAAGSRKLLSIVNQSSTATISCAFGIPAVIGGAGSFDIAPNGTSGATRVWNSYPVPADAVNCISSAATSPATVEAN